MTKSVAYVNLLLSILILTMAGCGSTKSLSSRTKALHQLVGKSAVFNNHFTGFSLYDPEVKNFIYNINADKYFTPASNTKIITLYSSLRNLPTTLPAYKFYETETDLVIKGMGDPTFLHPLWKAHPGFDKLNLTTKRISVVKDQYQDSKLGSGWAWDDFNEEYQVEVNDFPLFGNLVGFNYDSVQKSFQTNPYFFHDKWYWNLNPPLQFKVTRAAERNEFWVDTALRSNYILPFKTDANSIKSILEDTLKKKINLVSMKDINVEKWQILPGVQIDSVYAQMMKVSDNFIAEQLILAIGSYISDTCHTSNTLNNIKRQFFDTVRPFQWFDGSGLSRYNLVTPAHIIHVLQYIYRTQGIEWIKKIFPAGGESGTLKNSYKGNPPYVYAKTGSLMNNHSLSGYLSVKSGKWYIFSFMHSNYTGSVLPIRLEMQKTLEYIRDHY